MKKCGRKDGDVKPRDASRFRRSSSIRKQNVRKNEVHSDKIAFSPRRGERRVQTDPVNGKRSQTARGSTEKRKNKYQGPGHEMGHNHIKVIIKTTNHLRTQLGARCTVVALTARDHRIRQTQPGCYCQESGCRCLQEQCWVCGRGQRCWCPART